MFEVVYQWLDVDLKLETVPFMSLYSFCAAFLAKILL